MVKNLKWTNQALGGHIETRFFAMPSEEERRTWVADVMPIVLSKDRIAEQVGDRVIAGSRDRLGHLVGMSSQEFKDTGTLTLPWRLVPVGSGMQPAWLQEASRDHHVLCVDTRSPTAFKQLYPSGAVPVPFCGFEAILGLCNPGTKGSGFKACITADYDLFAIWPGEKDGMGLMHKAWSGDSLPGGVPRTSGVDERLKTAGHREYHRFGDVSPRVLTIKVMLNTALQAQKGRSKGGNLVHHNDEAGNFALAKGSLAECLPLIAFVPGLGTKGVENLGHFKELADLAKKQGHSIVAKKEWLQEAGVAG
jgi:hypothetical protein